MIETRFADNFDRTAVGGDWFDTSGGKAYKLSNGALNAEGSMNHPLWLTRPLPRNVTIELDAWSNSQAGDLKVELYGDGKTHGDPRGGAYTATGYVLIFGGWGNSKSMIARRDEHGSELAQTTALKVVPKQRYHWKIVRQGQTVSWFIDDMTAAFLTYKDADPMYGESNRFFAVNNWKADNWFDNLVITPGE